MLRQRSKASGTSKVKHSLKRRQASPTAHTRRTFTKSRPKRNDIAAATAIATNLTKDDRLLVAQYRARKPTLQERIEQTQDLYNDITLREMNASHVSTLIPFDYKSLPKHFHKRLEHEHEASGGYWLLRKPTLEAFNWVDKQVNSVHVEQPNHPNHPYPVNVPNLLLIYGMRGTGKSVVLAQTHQYCEQQGWITLPFTANDVIHDKDGLIVASTRPGQAGNYDQTLKSRAWLEYLGATYPEQLKAIELKNPEQYRKYGDWYLAEDERYMAPEDQIQTGSYYPFPAAETNIPRPQLGQIGSTLFDLVAVGAWRSDLSAWVADDVVAALKHQIKFPILVTIDDVNALDQISDYVDPQKLRSRLHPSRLSFAQLVQNLISQPPRRGGTIVCTNSRLTQHRVPQLMHRAGHRIRTLNYSSYEAQSMIEHYGRSKFIMDILDAEFLRRAEVVSGNNPLDLHKFAASQ